MPAARLGLARPRACSPTALAADIVVFDPADRPHARDLRRAAPVPDRDPATSIVNGTVVDRRRRAHRRDARPRAPTRADRDLAATCAATGRHAPRWRLTLAERATARCGERLGGAPPVDDRRPPHARSATPVRGVAVPLPTRREGPAKLTGQALYADDLVFPGAWYGATIRSTVPHARLLAIELDPAFDWTRVAVVTADDIPGRNVVASIAEDQPILVPLGGEIRHQAEPVALLAAADRDTLREAEAPGHPPDGGAGARLRAARLHDGLRPPRAAQGRRRRGAGRGRPGDRRGDLPRRPPGAAVHREQRDDRAAARGRRDHRPRQPPVPVLRAQGAARRARPRRRPHAGGPGGDRRRLRREGGVPVDDRAPRVAAGAQDRAAGADDLRPPRGPVRDDEAPPGGDPVPDRRSGPTGRSWPRTSTW